MFEKIPFFIANTSRDAGRKGRCSSLTVPPRLLFLLLLTLLALTSSCASSCLSSKSKPEEQDSRSGDNRPPTFHELLGEKAHPLDPENKRALRPLLAEAGKSRFALLGESTHGTAEYYTWRAAITRHLVQDHGFNLVVVEGDWPSVYEINRYVRGEAHQDKDIRSLLKKTMTRWPQWMWANEEFAELVQWLREHNQSQPEERQVGLYGMDIYDLGGSIGQVLEFFARVDGARGQDTAKVRESYGVMAKAAVDMGSYFQHIQEHRRDEEANVAQVVEMLRDNRERYVAASSEEAYFNAVQNARVVQASEEHYRANFMRSGESWNIRARRFGEAVLALAEHHGEQSRVVVWAHNTHVGDARATDMARRSQTNIGAELRKELEQGEVYAVGFGSYHGTVVAGSRWGSPLEVMELPPGVAGSWEQIMHGALSGDDGLLLMSDFGKHEVLSNLIGHRAVGVVYNPATESRGNYVPTALGRRYDAFIFIDTTRALTPLDQ